jgi:hypothetical protein
MDAVGEWTAHEPLADVPHQCRLNKRVNDVPVIVPIGNESFNAVSHCGYPP